MKIKADLEVAVLARGGKRKSNGVIEFRCPRHDDKKASAWMGEHAYGCKACGFEVGLEELAHDLNVPIPTNDYRIEDYALEKGFSIEKLKEFGVGEEETGSGTVVAIPYLDTDGTLLRTKLRGPNRKMWWAGGAKGVHLYGLHRLNGAKSVILVEGESDTHACWHHGVAALGVPGADCWRREWAKHLDGKQVYVWKEPDQGGETFVRAVARDIPSARVIEANGTKDLADLHRKAGEKFREELNRMAAEAVPIGAPKPPVPFDAIIGERLVKLLERKLKPVNAVPTPFPTWNAACRDAGGGRGLARGWAIIVGASSGTGKSVCGANLAHYAARNGERVTYVTLEMTQDQLATRMLAIMSGLPIKMLEQGISFSRDAFEEARRRVDEIHETHGGLVVINRKPIRKLADVVDSIRYNYEVHGSRYFIVDYLQLAWTGRLGSSSDLYTRIVEVSNTVAGLATELGVVMVGLSQFNRETTTSGQKPRKEGLMGGSSLENDADQVMLLHMEEDQLDRFKMLAILDKNRHGPKRDIPVWFDKETLRLEEIMPDEERSYRVGN